MKPLIILCLFLLFSLISSQTCESTFCYTDASGLSQNCPIGCTSCSLVGKLPLCSTCDPSYYFNPETLVCDVKNTCSAGGYYNATKNQCFACPLNCSLCYYNETNTLHNNVTCSSCKGKYFLNEISGICSKEIKCDSNQYFNSIDQKCEKCPSRCTVCVAIEGSTDVNCSSCQEGAFHNVAQGTCERKKQCNAREFYNSSDNSCGDCPENCKICEIVNETVSCQYCGNHFFLNMTTGICDPVAVCQENQYYNQTDNTCNNCPVNCTICFFDAENVKNGQISCSSCTSDSFLNIENATCDAVPHCEAPNFYNNSDNKCEPCPLNCTNCSQDLNNAENGYISCSSCKEGFWLNYYQNTCDVATQCETAFFYNILDNTCIECPEYCANCTLRYNFLICQSCKSDGWFNNETLLCDLRNICSDGGYYNESINQCFSCPLNCTICVYDSLNFAQNNITCKNCTEDSFFNETAGICEAIPFCLEGNYYNYSAKTCEECPVNCTTCVSNLGENQIKCLTCKIDAFYKESEGICEAIPYCYAGDYYNSFDNICTKCPNNCSICEFDVSKVENNQIACSVCNDDFFKNVIKGSCDVIPLCKNSSFYNNTDNTCNSCPYNCTECLFDLNNTFNDFITCTDCKADAFYNMIQGSCDAVPSCLNDTYYNETDNLCYKCPSNCTSCSINLNKTENKSIICETCVKGSFHNITNKSCDPLPFCNKGSYYDMANNTCKVCGLYCEECYNNLTCDTCKATGWLNETSLLCDKKAICKNGTYFNDLNNTCPVCPDYCDSCVFDENKPLFNNVTCTKCNETGWFNASEGFCYEKAVCTLKTYFNDTQNICFSCPVHCTNCSYDELNIAQHNISCSSCANNTFFNASSFYCDLKSVCRTGTFYNSSDNYCYNCPDTCSECTYDEENFINFNVSCSLCANDSYFDETNRSCILIPTCINGTFYNETDHLCNSCPANCNNCTANASDIEHNGTTCYGCDESAWFNPKKGSCSPRGNCSDDTYYNESLNTCLFCPFYCSVCNYDDTNPDYNNITCDSCFDIGFFNVTLGTCELKSMCSEGTYYNPVDNSCYDCSEKCLECEFNEENENDDWEKCTKYKDELD